MAAQKREQTLWAQRMDHIAGALASPAARAQAPPAAGSLPQYVAVAQHVWHDASAALARHWNQLAQCNAEGACTAALYLPSVLLTQ